MLLLFSPGPPWEPATERDEIPYDPWRSPSGSTRPWRTDDLTRDPSISPLGDRAYLIELPGGIDERMLARIRALAAAIGAVRGVTDVVPGFASLAVHFEPLVARGGAIRDAIGGILADARPAPPPEPREIRIPVRYGGTDGPDLEEVARHHGLAPEDVIAIHTAGSYLVHMIGFVPGFPYLGGLDPRIATPRRATPRTNVPAGSVGIGGAQTGVYPIASPGGWHLIGRTDVTLFDAARAEPSLLRVGDRVRFVRA